jgi:hypothetical protein
MKNKGAENKRTVIALSLLVILALLISSCGIGGLSTPTDTPRPTDGATGTEDRIAELEAQIVALMQDRELTSKEQQKLIAELRAEIAELKDEKKESETERPTETEPPVTFAYVVENGRAVITSVNTSQESVTFPSVIDGYTVSGIGSRALSSNSVKSVVISSGIEKIDWFAFSGCIALSSVSVPASVTSVGYGAFDNTSRALVIYCARDSFAHKYAQSYGITYDIT